MKRALAPTRYLFDPQLFLKEDFVHVIPTPREKFAQAKFYDILKVIRSENNVSSLMNSEKRLIVMITFISTNFSF